MVLIWESYTGYRQPRYLTKILNWSYLYRLLCINKLCMYYGTIAMSVYFRANRWSKYSEVTFRYGYTILVKSPSDAYHLNKATFLLRVTAGRCFDLFVII